MDVHLQPVGQLGEGNHLAGAGGTDVGAELVEFRLGHGGSIIRAMIPASLEEITPVLATPLRHRW
jgi:hypothetical protein